MAPSSLGEVIRQRRRERGLSQQQIEYMTGGKVKRNWLGQIERGRIKWSQPDMLQPLAEVLGTTVLELYQAAGLVDVERADADREEIIKRIMDVVRPLPDAQKLAILNFLQNMYLRPGQAEPSEKKTDDPVLRS